MVKAADKKKAIALFLRGYSIRQIVKKTKISRSTLERWSTKESWVENRDAYQHEAQRISAKALIEQDISKLITAGDIALDELARSFKEIETARNRRYSKKTIKRLFKNALTQTALFYSFFEAQSEYLKQRKDAEDILSLYNSRIKQKGT